MDRRCSRKVSWWRWQATRRAWIGRGPTCVNLAKKRVGACRKEREEAKSRERRWIWERERRESIRDVGVEFYEKHRIKSISFQIDPFTDRETK